MIGRDNMKTAETATASRQKAKISKVWIEHKYDESPDTSWLGEYSARQPAKGFYVDRETKELKHGGVVLATDVSTDYGRDQYQYIGGFQHNGSLKEWEHVDDKGVMEAFLRCRYKGNGNEQGLRGNLFEYFGVVDWEKATTRAEKIQALDVVYCCLAAYRLHRLSRGDWSFIGIIAKAEVISAQGICQTLRSGGLWGIESDSGADSLKEVANEQLTELRAELEGFGFGARAIDRAFQNVEVKD